VKFTRDLAIVPPVGVAGEHILKALFALCQWRFIKWWREGLSSCLHDGRDDDRHFALDIYVLLLLLHGGSQCSRMLFKQPLQSLAQVAEQMPTICDLNGLRRTAVRAFRKVTGAIAADKGNAWTLLQPSGEGLSFSIRKHIDGLVEFEIDNQSAIGAAFANGIELSRPVTEPARLQNRA